MNFAEYQEILRVIRPFVPDDRLQGAIPGMIVDVENKMLAASRHEGGILYPLEEISSEGSLVITRDYIDRLLKLQAPNWSGLKVKGSVCEIRVGRVQMSFSFESRKDYFFPNIMEKESTPITQSFLNEVASMAPYMNTDDRKINMYGMYASDTALYTCDNVRAVKKITEIPDGLKNTFFPFFCVNTIIKNRRIDEAVTLQGHIVFFSPAYVQYFTLLNTKFPPVEQVFSKLGTIEGIDAESMLASEDLRQFQGIRFSDQISSNLEVKIHEDKIDLILQSERGGADQIVIQDGPLSKAVPTPQRFVVDADHFLEGLRAYPNFRITKDAIVMRNQENTITYVVMRKVGL